jgi:hypothetical protein
MSLGLTAGVRQFAGLNDQVNFSSPEYAGGVLVGAVCQAIGFRSGRELKISKDLRIAPLGNRTGHPLGKFPHYHRRGPSDGAGGTVPGQGIGGRID